MSENANKFILECVFKRMFRLTIDLFLIISLHLKDAFIMSKQCYMFPNFV